MNSTWKTIVGVVLAILVIWGIYALSQGGAQLDGGTQQAEMADGPIKVGFVGPLSGDAAAYGEPALNVTQLAVDEINADGGINGRMIDLVVEDGQCDGATAASAAQKLINTDHVQTILTFCSGESLAVLPIAEAADVFVLSPASSSPDLTGISPMFARSYPSDASQAIVLSEFGIAQGWKNVAVVQETTDYALALANTFTREFKARGGNAAAEQFTSEETDFRTMLTKLKTQNPDALFIAAQTPASAARILQQLSDLDWHPLIVASDAVSGEPETVSQNAAILEGGYAAEFTVNDSTRFDDMIAAYAARFGAEPPFQSYAQTEYDAVYLLADALADVGNKGTALAAWFHKVNGWVGASGSVTIGENGDRIGGHVLKTFKDGKTVLYSQN